MSPFFGISFASRSLRLSSAAACILTAAVLFAAQAAHAAVYVNGAAALDGTGASWASPRRTIQDAVVQAAGAGGDEVWIASGVYVEQVTLAPNVELYGGFVGDGSETALADRDAEANRTILHGGFSGTALTFPPGVVGAGAEGLTITGGLAATGGGVRFTGADATNWLARCRIVGNTASVSGGGVRLDAASEPVIVNCLFAGNRANAGGGAMHLVDANPYVEHCTFAGNDAPAGSALLADGAAGSSPPVLNAIFADNTGGPAIEETSAASAPAITYSLFWNNAAGAYLEFGVATHLDAAILAIHPTLFYADPRFVPAPSGTWDGALSFNPSTNLTTLVDATASFTTGALEGLTLNPSSAVSAPQFPIVANTTQTISVAGDLTGFAAAGSPYGVFDYRLQNESGAVDAGGVAVAAANDLAGVTRPVDVPGTGVDGAGVAFDVGAIEFNGQVAFTLASSTVSEADGLTTLDLTLAPVELLSGPMQVDYAVTGGTATPAPGADFDFALLGTGTLALNPSSATASISISLIDDALTEGVETAIITLSNPVAVTLGAQVSHTLFITNSPAETEFADAVSTTTEDAGTFDVPLTFSKPVDSPGGATLDYAVVGGSATAAPGADFDFTLLGSGTLTLNPSATVASISIDLVDDSLAEGDETAILELSNPVGVTLGAQTTHTVTIRNVPSETEFVGAASFAGEDVGTVQIPLAFTKPVESPVGATVDYALVGGTATPGSDFTLLGSGTLTLAPGATTATIDVDLLDDAITETNETIEIALSNPTNLTLGAQTTHTLTILDDDQPAFRFSGLVNSVAEGVGTVSVTVLIDPPTGPSGAELSFAVVGGTATPGADFSLASPSPRTLGPGISSTVLTLNIVNDSLEEDVETIILELTGVVNGVLTAPTQTTVRILDDDLNALSSPSPVGNGSFGFTVAGLRDVTGDARGDVVVAAENETSDSGVANAGRVHVYNGSSSDRLFSVDSPYPTEGGQFGHALASLGDVTGDGRSDFLAGAPGESFGGAGRLSGAAHLFSGADGALLRSLQSPAPRYAGNFGYAVATVRPGPLGAVAVGAPSEPEGWISNVGRVYVFSTATGDLITSLSAPLAQNGAYFGFALAGVPDVNGNGFADLAVGAPGVDQVHVYDGATFTRIRAMSGEADSWFGVALDGLPDVNRDGLGDIIVGAYCAGPPTCAGEASVWSGAGLRLYKLVSPNAAPYGYFGDAVAAVPDVNGDGNRDWDVVVGAQYESGAAGLYAGRAYVFDGTTGDFVAELSSPNEQVEGRFGCAVAGVPDVNGDGFGDLVVGAFGEAVPSDPQRQGRAYVLGLNFSVTAPPAARDAAAEDWTLYE